MSVTDVPRVGLGCASPLPPRTLTELTVTFIFIYSSMASKKANSFKRTRPPSSHSIFPEKLLFQDTASSPGMSEVQASKHKSEKPPSSKTPLPRHT